MPEPLKPSSFRFYRGRSMRTSFTPGDCVFLEEVPPSGLRRGDVVVFRSEQPGGEDVVHRVIDVCDGYLMARGDDNPQEMVEKVPFSRLLGRVTSFQRRGRGKKPVAGGTAGIIRAGLVNREGIPARVFRFFYACVRKSGIARLFWRPGIEVVSLATEGDSVLRLVSGGKTVGKWYKDRGILTLRKPYDLVVRIRDASLR